MTHRYYHTPPQPTQPRARCPVCHEAVYSPAGIHPQCAVRQADPPKPKVKKDAILPANAEMTDPAVSPVLPAVERVVAS
jgi:hypothetical protein